MLINQISNPNGASANEELRNLAVAEFMAACPLMQFAQFYQITGNADSPRKSTDITGGDNRAVGSDYGSPKSGTPGFGSVTLKIYGDKVKTDLAYERRGIDIGSQRARDLRGFSRSLGRYFMDSFINDETSSTKFDGLKAQIGDLSRSVVLGGGADGFEVPAGNSSTQRAKQTTYIEALDAMIEEVDPTVIVADSRTIARTASIAREFVRTENVQDIFGQPQVLTHYRERPLVNAGLKKDRSGPVIGHAETVGETSDCTSLYGIRFGEEIDTTFATNVGIDVRDLGLVGSEYITLVEFDIDLVILDQWSVKRLEGIRITNN